MIDASCQRDEGLWYVARRLSMEGAQRVTDRVEEQSLRRFNRHDATECIGVIVGDDLHGEYNRVRAPLGACMKR